MLSRFAGKVWLNGEFGVSCVKELKQELPYVAARTAVQQEQSEWIGNALALHGAEAVLDCYGIDPSVPIGLSTVFNSHRRKKRGLMGISTYGRRLVRNACCYLERSIARECLTFATFTLPDVSRLESLAIGRQWAEIVRVFLQRILRGLLSADLPAEIVGVTEIQQARAERDGILALHLHLVFVGRKPRRGWVYPPSWYRDEWMAVISRYLQHSPATYNWTACENVQRVRYSAESYLGKYMSKGLKSVGWAKSEFGAEYLPSAWYSCSSSLRTKVTTRTRSLTSVGAEALVELCCDSASEAFIYRRPVQIVSDSGRLITLGWMGKIKPGWIDIFTGDRDEYNDRNANSNDWGIDWRRGGD